MKKAPLDVLNPARLLYVSKRLSSNSRVLIVALMCQLLISKRGVAIAIRPVAKWCLASFVLNEKKTKKKVKKKKNEK